MEDEGDRKINTANNQQPPAKYALPILPINEVNENDDGEVDDVGLNCDEGAEVSDEDEAARKAL